MGNASSGKSYRDIDFENDTIAWICHWGTDARNSYIIDGFYKTAKIVYDQLTLMQKNNSYSDDLAYPFLHTIRHTIELQLKYIAHLIYSASEKYLSSLLPSEEYLKIKFLHSIEPIFNFIKVNISKIDYNIWNSVQVELKEIEKDIKDFIPEGEVDPYRYATDRDGNENLSNINQISLSNAFNNLENFKQNSELVIDKILFVINDLKTNTFYITKKDKKVLNRNIILNIAKELMYFKDWNNVDFDKNKRLIKEKYCLSSNDLTNIIYKIQESRWLSYYIGYKRKDYSNLIKKFKYVFNINLRHYHKTKRKGVSLSKNSIRELKPYLDKRRKDLKSILKNLDEQDLFELNAYYQNGKENNKPEFFEDFVDSDDNNSYITNKVHYDYNYLFE